MFYSGIRRFLGLPFLQRRLDFRFDQIRQDVASESGVRRRVEKTPDVEEPVNKSTNQRASQKFTNQRPRM